MRTERKITWGDFFDFYENKKGIPTPVTNCFVNDSNDYQQKKYGYIDLAKKYKIIDDKSKEERNKITQQWHFFLAYLWEAGNGDKDKMRGLETQGEQINEAINYMKHNRKTNIFLQETAVFLPCLELTIWMAEVAKVIDQNGHVKVKGKDIDVVNMVKTIVDNKIEKSLPIYTRSIWKEINDDGFGETNCMWKLIQEAVKKEI